MATSELMTNAAETKIGAVQMDREVTSNHLNLNTVGFVLNNTPKEDNYGKYGPFEEQPKVRWGVFFRRPSLPESPSTVGTTFHLFTRGGSWTVDDEDYNKLKASDFHISRRTIFVIHGFGGEYL